MAVSLYEGPYKPLRSAEWVEPILTDHMFYAAGENITVEITDRFGRVYKMDSADEVGERSSSGERDVQVPLVKRY